MCVCKCVVECEGDEKKEKGREEKGREGKKDIQAYMHDRSS